MKPSPTLTFLFLLAAPLCAQTAPAAHRCYDYPPSGSPIEIPCPAPAVAPTPTPPVSNVVLPPAPSAPTPTATPAPAAPVTITGSPTPPQPPTVVPQYPANIFMAGAAYTSHSSPHFGGFLADAQRLTTSGIYSWSMDLSSINKQGQFQTSLTTGFGGTMPQLHIGKLIITPIILGNVGAVLSNATKTTNTAPTSTASLAFGGAAGAVLQLSANSQWSVGVWYTPLTLSTGTQSFVLVNVGYSPK